MNRANRRSLRTIAQLIVSAGFTALVSVVAEGLTPFQAGVTLAAAQVAVTWAQNFLEGKELVPEFLPPSPPEVRANEVVSANERYIRARLSTDTRNP